MSSCRLRRTRLMRLVNSLLWSPAVHRLATEVEAAGDVTHTSACCDQVKDLLPELRLITEVCPYCPPSETAAWQSGVHPRASQGNR